VPECIEYLRLVKHLVLVLVLVGCVGEASPSETSSELSKTDLEDLGFTCGTYDGLSYCTWCEWTWIDDAKTDGFFTCLNFYCEGDGDCEAAREHPRIDYWFEAEAGRAYHSMIRGATKTLRTADTLRSPAVAAATRAPLSRRRRPAMWSSGFA